MRLDVPPDPMACRYVFTSKTIISLPKCFLYIFPDDFPYPFISGRKHPVRGSKICSVLVFYKDELNRIRANQLAWQLYCIRILYDNTIFGQNSEVGYSFVRLINHSGRMALTKLSVETVWTPSLRATNVQYRHGVTRYRSTWSCCHY